MMRTIAFLDMLAFLWLVSKFKTPTHAPIKGKEENSAMANLEFARYGHTYLGEFVRAADQKAWFLLVAVTALLGALTTQKLTDWKVWVEIIAIVLAGLSAFFAVLSVKPRQHLIDTDLIA